MRTLRHLTAQRASLVAGVGAVLLLAAGCGGGSTSSSTSVAPAAHASTGALLSVQQTDLGDILVDRSGMTVYRFAADHSDVSTCSGSCATYWPYVPAPATLPAHLAGVDGALGASTRPDGHRQLTLAGRPLYTYVGDAAPGQTKGQGLNLSGGLWWVVSPDGSSVTGAAGASSTAGSTPSSGSGSGRGGYGGYGY
jgi:predicted lipoprotein with Yx(FWY)xxD motif